MTRPKTRPMTRKNSDVITNEKHTEVRKDRHSLSWWLDSCIPLPGGSRIGLDGIIGIIPGVGDAIGGMLSSVIFYKAYKRGVPKTVLTKMLWNITLDTCLGAIPLVGDIFDFTFKANAKNARMLEEFTEKRRSETSEE